MKSKIIQKWKRLEGVRGNVYYVRTDCTGLKKCAIVSYNFYTDCWEAKIIKNAISDLKNKSSHPLSEDVIYKEFGKPDMAVMWVDIYLSEKKYIIDMPFLISY